MSAELEAELWCQFCKTYVGKAWKQEVRPGFWEHYTEPHKVPKYCNVCENVIVRK